MDSRKPKTWLTAVLVTVGLLAVPTAVTSQCVVASTMTQMPGSMSTDVAKILTAPAFCQSTAMNAAFCSPTAGGFTTTYLLANAMSATMSPFCNWDCACGTGTPPDVVIDGSDGLPVELMDFAVEG